MPQVSAPLVSKELGFSAPTARSGLEHLLKAHIVEEITGKKRDKVYVYREYLNTLESKS
jgi:Fic family protein